LAFLDERIEESPKLATARASRTDTAAALGLYVAGLDAGEARARGAALIAVIAGGIALVWAERALDRPWRRVALPRRPRFWIVVVLAALTLPVAMLVPPLAGALRIAAVPWTDVALALAAAVGAVAWRAGGIRPPRAEGAAAPAPSPARLRH